jgi:hypothetical protein
VTWRTSGGADAGSPTLQTAPAREAAFFAVDDEIELLLRVVAGVAVEVEREGGEVPGADFDAVGGGEAGIDPGGGAGLEIVETNPVSF